MASPDLEAGRPPAQERIRRAALKLFAERGFNATGIRDIAESAEIPTSLLYHYSRSKDEILRDLLADGLGRHLESSRRALELARLPEQAVFALAGIHVLVPVRNLEMARLMETEQRALSDDSRAALRALRGEADSRWERVLVWGSEESVFDVADAPITRRLLVRMCTGIAQWFDPSGDMGVEDLVLEIADHALALVRAARDGHAVRAREIDNPTFAELQAIVDVVHTGTA